MDKNKRNNVIFILSLVVFIAILSAGGYKKISAQISDINFSMPAITNAFLDKEKYFPGDQMNITAETENTSSVKVMIENEKGYNETSLVMVAKNGSRQTWTGKWKVENSITGKIYNIDISAISKAGIAEKKLTWEDPNPGHPWNEIDGFPPECPTGQVVRGIGATLSCISGGGLPETAIWSSPTFSWWDSSPNSVIIGTYTIGSKGGHLGTLDGIFSGSHYCTDHLEYFVNNVRITAAPRVDIALAPGDIISIKKCYNAACTSAGNGSCSTTGGQAIAKIGFWEY